MLYPKQEVKQYILQGDLKTKKGVQITLVILLDNGELHLGRKYRKEKKMYQNFYPLSEGVLLTITQGKRLHRLSQ